ncbi:MAG TPA: UDP-3-O-(3-hydroxymyristoyl)glucosamine N-acyltransferase [Gemmatimonadaceae bacterium]|nr:UDP-3-O-(3-hydroxymyristoyl)glucosamine N-acyltransferase [Gemmatimonadaceae bacterium]
MIGNPSGEKVSGEGGIVLTAAFIADAVGGTLMGDPSVEVGGVAPLDRASPRELSFLGSAKYTSLMATTRAGVVLVAQELADVAGGVAARIVVSNPQEALLSLLPHFYRPPVRQTGIDATALIGRRVSLGSDVSIGAYAVIGDGAVIGDRSIIGPHCVLGPSTIVGADCQLVSQVTLYMGAVVGDRVTLHAGVRIGSDGFGYVQRGGVHAKIPHVGRCIVENDVEIGANTTIDRGSIDDTVVGAGTKIDNLVQIAHNVRIGKLCLIMAQVGIAGSARVGDGAMLLGQVGVSGHHTIGKGAILAAQAGVFGDIPPGETWSGYPARPHKQALRAQAALFKLPDLLRKIEKLIERSEKPSV